MVREILAVFKNRMKLAPLAVVYSGRKSTESGSNCHGKEERMLLCCGKIHGMFKQQEGLGSTLMERMLTVTLPGPPCLCVL